MSVLTNLLGGAGRTVTYVPQEYGAATVNYYISPTVTQAKSYLSAELRGKKPGAYQSRYETQIADLYDRIMNRQPFSYQAERDPLYRQYRDQYLRNGRQAMEDTVGMAAALTGGYGNSWAGTAGYQAYERYLQALNDKVPELEQRAQERYTAEGNQLRDSADLLMNLDSREYGWYRDAMNDWQFDAKLALEQAKFDLEVRKYQNQLLTSLLGAVGGSGGGGGGGGRSSAAPKAQKQEETKKEETVQEQGPYDEEAKARKDKGEFIGQIDAIIAAEDFWGKYPRQIPEGYTQASGYTYDTWISHDPSKEEPWYEITLCITDHKKDTKVDRRAKVDAYSGKVIEDKKVN